MKRKFEDLTNEEKNAIIAGYQSTSELKLISMAGHIQAAMGVEFTCAKDLHDYIKTNGTPEIKGLYGSLFQRMLDEKDKYIEDYLENEHAKERNN